MQGGLSEKVRELGMNDFDIIRGGGRFTRREGDGTGGAQEGADARGVGETGNLQGRLVGFDGRGAMGRKGDGLKNVCDFSGRGGGGVGEFRSHGSDVRRGKVLGRGE